MKAKVSVKKEVPDNISQFFINWAKDLISNDATVNKEHHGDEGVVYKIDSKGGNYFLKIKINSTFSKERERLVWFQGKLPVPRVVNFTDKDGAGAMLLTALEGKNLAALCKEWPVEKIIDKLADALHQFHKTDTQGWPFDKTDSKKILVHGDACLPNFIFNSDLFSGYIDLADAKLADPEIDLAAAIWSLQYNLGPGHGSEFLKKYGYHNTTEDMAEKLHLQYENYQQEHGFL